MATLAKAPAARLADLMPDLPPHDLLRRPETGTVMVRGRMGGSGAPFNLGEMTVTRCSVRLPCGTAGHAWVQGRDRGQAQRAAVLDALLQRGEGGAARIVATLAAEAAARAEARAARAAATRVEFFTLVRGEDA
jgi:alpha-D-ribose 1-methylphosphonate 5-triphosphate synthase subunit PhnG